MFLYKICSYAKKSSNIEGNACRSASDLISMDAKYCSG